MDLLTYSYSVTTHIHYVIDCFNVVYILGLLLKKTKGTIYTVEWNAKTLTHTSKILGMQIEPYNSKGTFRCDRLQNFGLRSSDEWVCVWNNVYIKHSNLHKTMAINLKTVAILEGLNLSVCSFKWVVWTTTLITVLHFFTAGYIRHCGVYCMNTYIVNVNKVCSI